MRTHTGDTPFSSEVYGKAFAISHISIHTEERFISYNVSVKVFSEI